MDDALALGQKYYEFYMQALSSRPATQILSDMKAAQLAAPSMRTRGEIEYFCGLACGMVTTTTTHKYYVFCVKNVWRAGRCPIPRFYFYEKPWSGSK